MDVVNKLDLPYKNIDNFFFLFKHTHTFTKFKQTVFIAFVNKITFS